MRRDTLEKTTTQLDGIEVYVENLLKEIQQNIYLKAKTRLDDMTHECSTYEAFKEQVKEGGFFVYDWDGTPETEAQIKAETQATIRCIPFELSQENLGIDMVSGKPATARVLIARSY